MTKYLIQHGPAKGSKIEKAIVDNYCDGVIFSLLNRFKVIVVTIF